MERNASNVNSTDTGTDFSDDIFKLGVAIARVEALCAATSDMASCVTPGAGDPTAERLVSLIFVLSEEAERTKALAQRIAKTHGLCACRTGEVRQ
jgi:hypothetical protein